MHVLKVNCKLVIWNVKGSAKSARVMMMMMMMMMMKGMMTRMMMMMMMMMLVVVVVGGWGLITLLVVALHQTEGIKCCCCCCCCCCCKTCLANSAVSQEKTDLYIFYLDLDSGCQKPYIAWWFMALSTTTTTGLGGLHV